MNTYKTLSFAAVAFLAACSAPEGAQAPEQGLAFRSISEVGACGLDATQIVVYADDYGSDDNADGLIDSAEIDNASATVVSDSGQIDPQLVSDIEDMNLGGNAPDSGVYWITDHFTALAEGSYDVAVTIFDENGVAIDSEIHDNVVVVAGQTTEDTFAFTCDSSDTVGALDVVVLVSEGPSVTGFSYDDGKFHSVCGVNGMVASFGGAPTDSLDVTWEVFPASTGTPTYPSTTALDSFSETIDGGSDSAYDFVCDAAGSYEIWVSVTNAAGQLTRFQTLAHCGEPALGSCDDGIDFLAYDTCTGEPETLDATCAEAAGITETCDVLLAEECDGGSVEVASCDTFNCGFGGSDLDCTDLESTYTQHNSDFNTAYQGLDFASMCLDGYIVLADGSCMTAEDWFGDALAGTTAESFGDSLYGYHCDG